MKYCGYTHTLCPRLVISEDVTFAGDTLTINIPAGSYNDREQYCIVVAQAIPDDTTISALVVVAIGDGTVEYPLVNRCGVQLTAAALRTRTVYSTVVSTNTTGGSFRITGKVACAPVNNLTSIDGTAPAAVADGGGA